MDNTSPLGPSERHSHGGSQVNGSGIRRPTTLMTQNDRKLVSPPQNLVLTIHKDASGYGMKVSGDKPVYVESVKPGGASQKAGLHEGDMILKVNGTNVRSSTHTNVVQLIKSSATVELTVQRNCKMQQRPSSISVGPSTPLAQRGGITGPKPVDSATSHDVKMTKIQTLHLYLDKEKKNLENLKSTNANRQDILRAEHTIRTLQEQLQLLCVEGSTMHNLFTPIQSPPTILHPQPAPPSTPAFLSRFPRSLSSLSLGGKKKPTDKENTVTQPAPTIPHQTQPIATSPYNSSGGETISPTNYPALSPTKKSKISASHRDLKNADIPPPLPERNIPRPKHSSTDSMDGDVVLRRNIQISDLDHGVSGMQSPIHAVNNNTQSPLSNKSSASSSSAGKGKQRSKQKMKALSDPKMSSQMFIQMEQAQGNQQQQKQKNDDAPPLPPRLPGMLEEKQNLINNNKFGKNNYPGRPPPNSLETHLSYPLIATCTAVREDLSAFPLSHRPNIVQQLQQSTHHHHLQSPNSSATTIAATSVSKSTALGLTPQQMSKLNSSQHRRVVSSPEHYHQREPSDPIDDRRLTTSGSWDIVERDNETTPADGTPPPRYSPTPNPLDDSMTDSLFESSYPDLNRPSNVIHQRQIISMEDDEMTEEQDSINEDHGPFRSLHQLLEQENLAYLSVFLNFVLSNSNPSPLLFYLITGLYKDGTMKDMRKWAYELHSTFLVPRAPLLWCGVDESESLARDVDNVLQNEHQKIEILRSIFRKSRQRAKEHINQQIEEFKIKRTAGLGTLYGPSDHQLMESKGDKVKEQKVFEETLVPKLQQLVDELEKESPNECPKKSALSSALSTVLHRIFVTRSNPGGPIDRVHHFVSREKSFKSRLMGKNRKAMVRGHHLVLRQYYEVAHCNHCQNIIWGVSPQGYHCTDCELNIHRACSKVLEENCPGPAPSKQKGQHTDKMTKFIDKIRPTHIFNERPRRQDEDGVNEELATSDRPTSTSVVRQPSDRRPDVSNSSTAQTSVDFTHTHSVDTDSNAPDAEPAHRDSSKSKSAPVSVNRSESYKERLSHRRNRNNRRKTSDPSLSKTNDEQQVDLGISNVNFASSSSSLSSSPSTSLEAVGAPTAGQGTIPAPRQWVDSDDEAGDNIADWSSNVAADILQTLSDGEKKRQEIINEIYQTERNHVRTLRLLEYIFMRPLQESGALNAEHLNLLFPPALLILKDHHSSFEQQLKQRRIEHGSLVGDIGDLLLTMFDGRSGEELKEHAAHFCARQQIALEALKEKRRKDENLQRFLTKAEAHKACRRLQLKDLLPTALQRLTKYPLLFESLYKITVRVSPDNDAEAIAVRKALDSSKRILDHVNQAVRHAEDAHKLQTIQKKLDKANYEKEASSEFKNVDLTQHKLLHDGPLIMKKNPSVQLHGLLFENMMVLLQKQDDKYILKFHNNPGAGAAEGKSIEGRFNPISKINLILVRRSAVDTNAFFLINTSVTQMLELTAPSSSECKTWFKHISDAAEAYKSRTKGNHDISEDPIPATLSNSPTKESLEGTPEKELSPSIAHSDPSNVSISESQKNISNDANEQNNNSDVKDVHDEKQIGRGDTMEDDEEEVKIRHRKYSSGTRILTQQQSLIDPSEVQISVSPVLTAEPVLTPQEQLRRLDEAIRFKLAEKQKVICDMYRVPNEHFSEIADIAGQPEAPKEPSDIVLAAFAQVQSLTETLNDHMKVSCRQELLAISKRVCDDCHSTSVNQTRHSHKNSSGQVTTKSTTTTTTATTTPVDIQQAPTLPANARNGAAVLERMDQLQDDDGYCEIDELRLPTTINNLPQIPQSTANTTPELKRQSTISADSIPEETEHEINAELLASSVLLCDSELGDVTEVNDTYDGTVCDDEHAVDTMGDIRMHLLTSCMESISGGNQMNPVNSLAPAVPCHLLTQFVATLNSQLSLLLPKLNERDIEREKLRKENQHLRELLNSMHERERVSSERETPERASDIRKSSSQESTN